MTRSRALDSLLDGLVDYAGLFPPAALPMGDAVVRFARYLGGADRRLLGAFVVPVPRLDELARAVAALGSAGPAPGSPWRLSVLAEAKDRDTVADFAAMHSGRLAIDTIEAKATDSASVEEVASAFASTHVVYVEIPVRDDLTALIRAIGDQGLRAKVRTGGVTADAFPTSADLLRFLRTCHEARVAFKATAGLHHPLRGEYALTYAENSARGTMYGFLNVFLAAVLLREGVGTAELTALLEESEAGAIGLAGDAIHWRSHRVTAAQVVAARATFACSFGSCSFEEPVRDLSTLQLT